MHGNMTTMINKKYKIVGYVLPGLRLSDNDVTKILIVKVKQGQRGEISSMGNNKFIVFVCVEEDIIIRYQGLYSTASQLYLKQFHILKNCNKLF